VREAAAQIPPEVCSRFETAANLDDKDRAAIIQIARLALVPFKPKSEGKPDPKAATKDAP
jgi:F-type H+-transporting ATPase subunit alpha